MPRSSARLKVSRRPACIAGANNVQALLPGWRWLRRLRLTSWSIGPPTAAADRYVMSHKDAPRLAVDFNELVADDLVLLSKVDRVVAADGKEVLLRDGLRVVAYEHNQYSDGTMEYLYAEGVAERNDPEANGAWTRAAKWCCRFKGGVKQLGHAP